MQYDKKNIFSLLSDLILIKSLPEGTKVLRSLIATNNKKGDCYDAWKFVARQFENGSYHIKGIDFDESYIPVANADSFIIKFSITSMHRLTATVLYVSNTSMFKSPY